jgi:hypothetical protein
MGVEARFIGEVESVRIDIDSPVGPLLAPSRNVAANMLAVMGRLFEGDPMAAPKSARAG